MNVAIVTGVSRGLGEALAFRLLARDWQVIGVGRSASSRLAHPAFRLVQCDLADVLGIPAAVDPALQGLASQRPARACLINNAAVAGPAGVIGRIDNAALVASLAVNLAAPTALSNRFLAAFNDAAVKRRIINVSSGAAQMTLAGGSIYCIAKAGLEMLTQSTAAEHQISGVEAITLRPGIIDTEMQTFMRNQPKEVLPSVDLFRGFHESGQLVAADKVASDVVAKLVEGEVENSRMYRYPADF
jgi:benzil reductase ((S)-benzoin forming)